MKKAMFFAAIAAAVVTLTGCSHNVGTAFSGKLVNVGYDPEVNKVGIQYYDGVMVTGVNRENSKHTLAYESTGEGQSGETTTGGTKMKLDYSAEVGKQITGYYVDAIEAGATPEQLDAYVETLPKESENSTPETATETAETPAEN